MIPLFMSGLPGRMALAVAEEAEQSKDIELQEVSLSGEKGACPVGERNIRLIHADERSSFLEAVRSNAGSIVVDYTHPSAVEGNVEFYTQNKIPFVLGTTGGNYEKVEDMVVSSSTPAVVAPNMGLPIVAITAMLDWASKEFPGVFRDYALNVKESHQEGKADTSGTAKDLVSRFQALGADFSESDLKMCRDAKVQSEEWGIPDEHLKGHAYHTYDLNSSDGTAHFSLSHNILGRSLYARGTLDGVRFLSQRLDAEAKGSYSMMDVLRNL
jgi:4-hydroxy-tetrahydrodipicolinate reductase